MRYTLHTKSYWSIKSIYNRAQLSTKVESEVLAGQEGLLEVKYLEVTRTVTGAESYGGRTFHILGGCDGEAASAKL